MTDTAPSSVRRVLGILALVPALIALAVGYVWPTVWTVRAGFTRDSFFSDGGGSAAHNWGQIWSRLGHSLVYASLVSVGPLIAVLVVAPLLAASARDSAPSVRRIVRVVLALATVSVAPIALAVAWLRAHRLPEGAGNLAGSWPSWVIGFAMATGIAATVYLSAAPRSGLVIAGIAVCTVLAVSLQDFILSYFRPSTGTPSPMNLLARTLFQSAALGPASALATALMALLAVLGLVAAVTVVWSRLRIEPRAGGTEAAPDPVTPGPSSPVGAIVGALLLFGVLGYTLWPWLTALFSGEMSMPAPPGAPQTSGRILLATWTPTFAPALVGCVLATVAGYGLGALRPFGRRSEFALLAFAPWLFVGIGPLLPHAMASLMSSGTLGIAPPPVWLNIPVLFVATIYFAGHHRLPDDRAVLRFLPILGVLFLVSWAALAQDTLWWFATDQAGRSAPTLLLSSTNGFRAALKYAGIGLASPPPMLLLLAATLIALHLTVLDRLRVTTGAVDEPSVEAEEPTPGSQAALI